MVHDPKAPLPAFPALRVGLLSKIIPRYPPPAGQGFLRFSCAEPDDRLVRAVQFLKEAVRRSDRVRQFLDAHSKYRV